MKKNRISSPKGKYLEDNFNLRVRFQEVDALKIVWHGNYITYLEEGRSSFGRKYGIDYVDMQSAGLMAPIVHCSCDYLSPTTYGDELLVHTRLFQQKSAKLEFYYEISKVKNQKLCAVGKTVQVFLDQKQNLILSLPEFMDAFYQKWQDRILIHHE